ncbi:MAG: TIGR00304 family protein [Methanobacterium sp.]|nr:TIGR00304 family protein [Methanobacterium sp.]HHX99978.1 TIGR00304 family protein [Methanothermobacter sp.]
MIKGETLIFIGIAVVIVGVLLTFLGTAILSSGKNNNREGDNTKVSTGGVILIGPIPIIFGNDKSMITVTILGAIILMVIAYFLFYRGGS